MALLLLSLLLPPPAELYAQTCGSLSIVHITPFLGGPYNIPATAAGNSLVIITNGTASLSDGGDSFTLFPSSTDPADLQTHWGVFYSFNIAGGATTITSSGTGQMWVYELNAQSLTALAAGFTNGVANPGFGSSTSIPGPPLQGSSYQGFYVASGTDTAGGNGINSPFIPDTIIGQQEAAGHLISTGLQTPQFTRAFFSGSWQTTGAVFGFPDGSCTPAPATTEYVRGVWVFDQGTLPPPPATPLAITSTSSLPTAAQNSFYSVTLQAAGGVPPYSWTVVIGTPPTGITLDASTAALSGIPTTAGTSSSFTVQVMDSVNVRATKDLSLTVSGTPTPGGQEDLLQWVMMDSRRYTQHLDGTWTFLSPADDHGVSGPTFWWIKSATGNPWDIDQYDASNLYFWITENGEQAPLNPSAYKRFLTPVPLAPRFFTPGDTVTIDTAAPNQVKRTLNCEADNQPLIDLGHIRGVTSGPTSIAWGGTLGTQSTIELDYFWGGSGATYNTRERFSFVKGSGRVKWDTAHWDGVSSYIVDSSFTHNTLVSGGTPTPNFACGYNQSWWPNAITHSVSLTWPGSAGATSYNAWRSTFNGGCSVTSKTTCSKIASGLTQPSYTDPNVKSGITYFYVVTAVNAVGESAPSNQVSAPIP